METNYDQIHERNKKKVCIICCKKGNESLYKPNIEFIKEHLIEDYDEKNPDFPNAICSHRKIILTQRRKDENIQLPTWHSQPSYRRYVSTLARNYQMVQPAKHQANRIPGRKVFRETSAAKSLRT